MNSPFESGYRDLVAQAKKNPLESPDQLPASDLEAMQAQFNVTFNEERTTSILERMNQKLDIRSKQIAQDIGAPGDDIKMIGQYGTGTQWERYKNVVKDNVLHDRFMRIYQNGIENADEVDQFYTREFGAEWDAFVMVQDQIAQNPDKYKTDRQLLDEVRADIQAETAPAKQVLMRSDSIIPQFIGAAGAVVTDPAVIATAPIGGSGSWVNSGRVISKLTKGFLATGATAAVTEALIQPDIKSVKNFLGEDFDAFDALQNVAAAGLAGGVLDTFFRGSGEALKKWLKGSVDTAKVLDEVDLPPEGEAARLALRDFALINEQALRDDFPLSVESYQKHLELSSQADEYLSNFDQPIQVTHDIPEPKATEDFISPSDSLYDEILTEKDKAFDAELFAKAEKIIGDDDIIPFIEDIDPKGEMSIGGARAKDVISELDNEVAALDSIRLCMMGGK